MSLPFVGRRADGASVSGLMQIDECTLLFHQQHIMKEVCLYVPLLLPLEFRVTNIYKFNFR